jgi:hypothetical protein
MKHLQVYEGDWWDNDPNAPWNQDDREPDEFREIEIRTADQKFECVALPEGGGLAILKAKPGVEPAGLWVTNLDGLESEYQLRLSYGEDDDYDYETDEVAVVNYATDLYNNTEETMSSEDWLDGATYLTPLSSPEIRDDAISLLEGSLRPGYGRPVNPDKTKSDSIRMAIHMLEKIKFDDETPY